MYDFDARYDRRPHNSVKWSFLGECRPGGEDAILPLWVADMDFAVPPAVRAAVEARAAHPIYGYAGKPAGFYEAFESWMLARHGQRVERETVLFSPGIVPGLSFAVDALTEPGDGVVIQPPVYFPFRQVIERNGRRVVENPLACRDGRWEIDFEDLERKAEGAKALILCSPHNPVGRVWTRGELERLVDIVRRRGLLLVSDEIHSDLVRPPRRHVPALAFAEALGGRLVSFHAPSKTFNIAGLQTSYVVIPDPELRRRFDAEEDRFGLKSPNVFGAAAAEAAYREGGPWLDELLDYVAGNEAFLRAELAKRLPELAMAPMEGSFLAWIDFRKARFEGGLHAFLLEKAKLWLDEGSRFGTGGAGWVRLNLGCPRATLAEAIDRLEAALRR